MAVVENKISAETKKGFEVRGTITMGLDKSGRPRRFFVSDKVVGSGRKPTKIEIVNEAPK